MTFIFSVLFVIVEVFVASDPVLSPTMMRQKIPLLVGASNFLSATCNFSITYFFPMWFQVVTLESASTAGTPSFLLCSMLAHSPMPRPAPHAKQHLHGLWFGVRGLDDAQDGQIQSYKSHSWNLSVYRRRTYIHDA